MSTHRHFAIAAAIVSGLVFASCDSNPTRPSGQPPPPLPQPPVSLTRLDVSMPQSIAPQTSAQLAATAVKSDGSTEDVTTQAQWSSSSPNVVQVSASGLATASRVGEVTITARYQSRSASAPLLALMPGTYKLTGRITEAGSSIDGVGLAVVSGVGEGLATRTRDGYFTFLGVGGRVVLQAKKDGYDNKLETIIVNESLTHDFEMTPVRQRTNLAGTYSLRLTANCDPRFPQLPEVARSRTYIATVSQQGADLKVTLSGSDFVITNGRGNTFDGSEDPFDNVRFMLGSNSYYYYYYFLGSSGIVERLTPTTSLLVTGVVNAKGSSSAIVGGLDGTIQVKEGSGFPQPQPPCYSRSHSFEMRRQ
jgi:Big-like domain-containing protein